jgi:hypothetical protein
MVLSKCGRWRNTVSVDEHANNSVVTKVGVLENIWTSDKGHSIPRVIRFMNDGANLAAFWLESGEM